MNDKILLKDNHNGSRHKVIAKITKCLSACVCKGEYHVDLLTGSYVVECLCKCHQGDLKNEKEM
jgi:hypothetical protein